MNELERLKAKKEELKKDKKIMSYEEQIQELFNQPIKRIKASTKKEKLEKYLKYFSRKKSKKITACSKDFINLLDFETKEKLRKELLQILFIYQGQVAIQEQTAILKSLYRLGVRKIGQYKLLSTGMVKIV